MNMKTKLKPVLIVFFIFSLACNKAEEEFNNEVLKGIWIHTETKTDTMDFNIGLFASENAFELKRGKEVRNGYTLSKIGSDIYRYKLKGDSIYLNGMLSSYAGYFQYYFKMSDDNKSFKIGSFAPFTGGLMVNEFRRIE